MDLSHIYKTIEHWHSGVPPADQELKKVSARLTPDTPGPDQTLYESGR
jgi:hypothetical protein